MDDTLETARLRLRPPEEGDISVLVPLIGNFSVSKNLSVVPHPYTEADGLTWVRTSRDKRLKGTDFIFALIRKTDNAFIGACGAHPSRDFELGYWLGEPYWGHGYATEGARRVVQFAFDVLGAAMLHAGFVHDNPASGRVLMKLGFTYTHDKPYPCLARGTEVPARRMALTREQFLSIVTP